MTYGEYNALVKRATELLTEYVGEHNIDMSKEPVHELQHTIGWLENALQSN